MSDLRQEEASVSSPFLIDGPTVINFSGGRTSGDLLRRVLAANGGELPKDALVTFENTGKEDEKTLQFIDRTSTEWNVPITWLEYTEGGAFKVVNFETASRDGEPFDAVIRQRGGILPNPRARYCSSEMKTRTLHRYLRELGWTEWDSMVGIRADEPRRAAKFRANPHPETPRETVRLPLAESGIAVADVLKSWSSEKFGLELLNVDGVTPEGNCDLCMLKPAARVLSLIQAKPSRGIWWAKKEKEAEAVATGNGCRFRDDRPSYQQMMTFAEKQVDMFDANEEAISCFCGD